MKIALNRVLTLPDDGKCPALLISCGIIDLGAFCVELWPKQVLHRISVPMPYISFLSFIYLFGLRSVPTRSLWFSNVGRVKRH